MKSEIDKNFVCNQVVWKLLCRFLQTRQVVVPKKWKKRTSKVRTVCIKSACWRYFVHGLRQILLLQSAVVSDAETVALSSDEGAGDAAELEATMDAQNELVEEQGQEDEGDCP